MPSRLTERHRTRLSLRTKLAFASVVPLLLVVALGVVTAMSLRSVDQSGGRVKQTHAVIADARQIEKLVVGVVEMQMRKIELKLRQCEELDAGLTREREALERQTARANAERKAAKRAAEEEAKRLAAFRAQAEADAAAIAAKRAETEAARKAAEEARIASVPPEPRGGE